ncbi:LPS export ABC transporter periplasmic protein LptC [Pseudodesulfovibrio cashew]|uniref:LPS export ABC transporter periplasmic protein LptC n=1 Tax=Pseudodesulfovibrio cashew TaxID=2678688 RepID=A0A6I6JJI7_9BACT|nr:LPS export ABC transporter periplasmic protein LptC [Pseudodesulfovibrio cashew]QGY41128.1 LPS export ABC transporter periplasmic protein LptC [Pseudodesulfovibrio cashew]
MRKRPALSILIIFAVGMTIGIAVKTYFFSDPLVMEQPAPSTADMSREELLNQADIVAEDIELVQGKQGAMTWKLLAKTAKYNQKRKLIGVTRPQLTAYFGEDRKEVYVKADRGEVDQSNDNLTLYDNITGRFGDMELVAQYLDYVGAIKKVYLKGGVTVRRPDMTLTATAVEIDLVSRELTAAGDVKALMAPGGMRDLPFNQ